MSAVVIKLPVRAHGRACAEFVQGQSMKFCRRCGFARLMHKRPAECSACGCLYAARKDGSGYSHCDAHAGMRSL